MSFDSACLNLTTLRQVEDRPHIMLQPLYVKGCGHVKGLASRYEYSKHARAGELWCLSGRKH